MLLLLSLFSYPSILNIQNFILEKKIDHRKRKPKKTFPNVRNHNTRSEYFKPFIRNRPGTLSSLKSSKTLTRRKRKKIFTNDLVIRVYSVREKTQKKKKDRFPYSFFFTRIQELYHPYHFVRIK